MFKTQMKAIYVSQYLERLAKTRTYNIPILLFEILETYTQCTSFHIFTSILFFIPTCLPNKSEVQLPTTTYRQLSEAEVW